MGGVYEQEKCLGIRSLCKYYSSNSSNLLYQGGDTVSNRYLHTIEYSSYLSIFGGQMKYKEELLKLNKRWGLGIITGEKYQKEVNKLEYLKAVQKEKEQNAK